MGFTTADIERIADAIVQAVGPHCEVVFHDLSDIEHSIVALAGDVTHRKVGGGPTDLLLERVRNSEFEDILNYRTVTDDGRVLRSSSVFLRGADSWPMGVFCINVDISAFLAFERTIRQIIDGGVSPWSVSEAFAQDIEETIRVSVAEVAAEIGKPLGEMTRAERIRLIGKLDHKGAFQIKRAVPLVAAQLGVSRFTVYTYLQEARSRQDGSRA